MVGVRSCREIAFGGCAEWIRRFFDCEVVTSGGLGGIESISEPGVLTGMLALVEAGSESQGQ